MEATKYQRIENSRTFVDEYDYIYETLHDLKDYTTDKELKKEIDGLIDILMEDYDDKRDECEQYVLDNEEDEETYLINGQYLDRL